MNIARACELYANICNEASSVMNQNASVLVISVIFQNDFKRQSLVC